MMKAKFIVPALLTVLAVTWSVPALAAMPDASAMKIMASSSSMRGTTSFYYENEWLVRFVQFVISWLCIIALLVYYAGWLCSMVVLSNKELFYLIDTIKKEAQSEGGSDGKNMFGLAAVMNSFKNGSANGVNGGLDNILLFILALSINFKAYSYYKDVEAGSDSESGSKFNYNDTMLNFILKTLIPAVTITFVTSVAISGVLLQCWFTIGDVFIIRAERFATTNLSAKIDELLGDSQGYSFTLGSSGTQGAEIAEDVARTMYSTIKAEIKGATPEQLQALGIAVEDEVARGILGGSTNNYYKNLEGLVKNSVPDAQKPKVVITNEDQARLVDVSVVVNRNPKTSVDGTYSVPVKDILKEAKIAPDVTNSTPLNDLYLHTVFSWRGDKANGAVTDKKSDDAVITPQIDPNAELNVTGQ